MEFNKVFEKVNKSPRGSFHAMVWERPLKMKKGVEGHYIVKRSFGSSLRFGVEYDNMKAVKEGREKGDLPAENAGLIGRSWIVPNLFMESHKSGAKLLRVSMASGSKFATEYFDNGKKVAKEDIAQYVLKSEIAPHSPVNAVFDINVNSIIAID